jgi:hypothetical protein
LLEIEGGFEDWPDRSVKADTEEAKEFRESPIRWLIADFAGVRPGCVVSVVIRSVDIASLSSEEASSIWPSIASGNSSAASVEAVA